MPNQLKKCLSLWDIVVYGVGLILGAGIYVLIGAGAGIAGNMLWLSFLIAGLVASFTAMSYSELSSMYPKSAAEFLFVREAFGSKDLAWFVGFFGILIGFSSVATVALGFAQYFTLFLPINTILIAIGLIVFMSGVSFWGIKQSARFNLVATTIEVGGLLLIIVIGGYQILTKEIPPVDLLSLPELKEGAQTGFYTIVSVGALMFFAYIGFEDIANIAEEAINPQKVLSKAFIYSLTISTIIYILVAIVVVHIVPYNQLASTHQPLSLVMKSLIGRQGSVLITVIALFATANTALVILIVSARMLYGMSKEGSLPLLFSRVHKTRKTPWFSVIVTGIITLLFLSFREIKILASISNIGIFLVFLFVNISNILLRYKKPNLKRPWRTPLNIKSFPLISSLGAISCIAMLIVINHDVEVYGMQIPSLLLGLIVFAMTIPIYFISSKFFKKNKEGKAN